MLKEKFCFYLLIKRNHLKKYLFIRIVLCICLLFEYCNMRRNSYVLIFHLNYLITQQQVFYLLIFALFAFFCIFVFFFYYFKYNSRILIFRKNIGRHLTIDFINFHLFLYFFFINVIFRFFL